MEYKKKIENILPLIAFVTDYDKGKFAGRLLKRFDYDFLLDQFPKFDPSRAHEQNYRGYFKAVEKWYRINYGDWKAGHEKKETIESMDKLGDILQKEFGPIFGSSEILAYVKQTRKDIENAKYKGDYKTVNRLIKKLRSYGY